MATNLLTTYSKAFSGLKYLIYMYFGRHIEMLFLSEKVWISIKILLKFVPTVPVNDIPALIQIMALRWRRQAIIWSNGG